MRTLNIPSTKASKARLALLRGDDPLPLPLDPEAIRPFGFRFSGAILCVTYEGKDVAYASDQMAEDDKSFDLRVLLPQNETVDRALHRFFATLKRHMDQVGRILAQEKREEKARREAEWQAAQDARANAPDGFAAFRGGNGDPIVRGIRYQDLAVLDRSSNPQDPFTLFYGQIRTTLVAGDLRYGFTPGADGLILDEGATSLDAGKLGAELQRRLDRAHRLTDPAPLIAAVHALPEPRYLIQRFSMNGAPVPSVHEDTEEVYIDLDETVQVRFYGSRIDFRREGCSVFEISVCDRTYKHESWIPGSPQDCFMNYWRWEDRNKNWATMQAFGEEGLNKIGSLWIETVLGAEPDADLSAYASPDQARLVAEAEKADAGYAF